MIKSVLKIIIYFITFLYMLLFFLPKQELYNFGLTEVKKFDVQIAKEEFLNKPFGFSINNANIYLKGIESANVKALDLDILLYSNVLSVNDIKVSENFKKFVPSTIDNLSVSHSIIDPLFVYLAFDGKEYKGDGKVDLLNQKVIINLYPSNKFVRDYRMLLKGMKKINNKEYRYEYSL